MKIEEIKNELKNTLSEKRFIHSLGVMKKAKELAICYGEDEEKAEIAGLIHDVAKEMKPEEIDIYVKEHGLTLDEFEKKNWKLAHGKIGANIAKEKYHLDTQVQNAILYHTTGNKNMDNFAKIIYIADKIEENRNYEGIEELRECAKTDLDETMLRLIEFVLQKNLQERKIIHTDTIEVWNKIIEL